MKVCTLEDKEQLIAELCHQINSPLAAVRNAVYLAGVRVNDPAALHYLALANDEITAIAAILRETRALIEAMAAESLACQLADCPIAAQASRKALARAASMPATGRAA